MGRWTLWAQQEPIKQIRGFEPLLAQWEKASHPAQQRLESYLSWLTQSLGILSEEREPLFLDLEIDVHEPSRLTHHYDLENYLTPLFGSKHLDSKRFVLVTANKRVGGGSGVTVGRVRVSGDKEFREGWNHFAYHATGAADLWKASLRSALASSNPESLPSGPCEVILAWRGSPLRNWVSLWKPTGDAMGPILGEPQPTKPFYPNDDRIVRLALHRTPDLDMSRALDIGLWWRLAPPQNVG